MDDLTPTQCVCEPDMSNRLIRLNGICLNKLASAQQYTSTNPVLWHV